MIDYRIHYDYGIRKWVARRTDFKSPSESPEGIGDDPVDALEDLMELLEK